MFLYLVEQSAEGVLECVHSVYDQRERAVTAVYDKARQWANAEVGERHCSVQLDSKKSIQDAPDGLVIRFEPCGEHEVRRITVSEKRTERESGWLTSTNTVLVTPRRRFVLYEGDAPELDELRALRKDYAFAQEQLAAYKNEVRFRYESEGDLELRVSELENELALASKAHEAARALQLKLEKKNAKIAHQKAKIQGLRSKLGQSEQSAPSNYTPETPLSLPTIDFSQVLAELQMRIEKRKVE